MSDACVVKMHSRPPALWGSNLDVVHVISQHLHEVDDFSLRTVFHALVHGAATNCWMSLTPKAAASPTPPAKTPEPPNSAPAAAKPPTPKPVNPPPTHRHLGHRQRPQPSHQNLPSPLQPSGPRRRLPSGGGPAANVVNYIHLYLESCINGYHQIQTRPWTPSTTLSPPVPDPLRRNW